MKKGLIIAIVAVGVIGFVAYNRYKKTHEVAAPVAVESQAATFEGFTKLNDKTFDKLQVMGDAELENVQVTNEATIEAVQVIGMLDAKACSIQGLVITTESSMLNACKVKTVMVKKSAVEGVQKPQVLELDNTVVEGDVTFEAGNGQIVLKGDARVAGAIIGGAVKK